MRQLIEGCEQQDVTIKDILDSSPHDRNVLIEEDLKNVYLDTSLARTNLVLLQMIDYARIDSTKTNNSKVTSVIEDTSAEQQGKAVIVYPQFTCMPILQIEVKFVEVKQT